MKIIYSFTEYMEEFGKPEGYYKQFKNTATNINVGDRFVVLPNTWQERIVEALYVDELVALTNEIKGLSPGRRSLYYSGGMRIGWAYADGRPQYRLQIL